MCREQKREHAEISTASRCCSPFQRARQILPTPVGPRFAALASTSLAYSPCLLTGETQAHPEAQVVVPGGRRVAVAVGSPAAARLVVPPPAADAVGATRGTSGTPRDFLSPAFFRGTLFRLPQAFREGGIHGPGSFPRTEEVLLQAPESHIRRQKNRAPHRQDKSRPKTAVGQLLADRAPGQKDSRQRGCGDAGGQNPEDNRFGHRMWQISFHAFPNAQIAFSDFRRLYSVANRKGKPESRKPRWRL